METKRWRIICLGEELNAEKPGDVNSLRLPAGQYNLVEAIRKNTSTKVVLVFFGGHPRTLPQDMDTVLLGFLPGPDAGRRKWSLLMIYVLSHRTATNTTSSIRRWCPSWAWDPTQTVVHGMSTTTPSKQNFACACKVERRPSPIFRFVTRHVNYGSSLAALITMVYPTQAAMLPAVRPTPPLITAGIGTM